jgi:phosphatidate cytidylyltransferase
MLKQRLLTGVILIILALAGLYWLPMLGFTLALAAIFLMAAWEMSLMFGEQGIKQIIFLVLLIVLFWSCQFLSPLLICGIAGLWWLFSLFLLAYYVKKEKFIFHKNRSGKYFSGILILVPSFFSLVVLQDSFGPNYVLCLLLIVWASDIGAYFTGKKWGKHLLIPKISPKKTVEGLIGGVILALLVGMVVNWQLLHFTNWLFLLILILVVSLWSVIGDLLESMLKRAAKIKDSGNFLPGHGGVYDRIDSLTSAAPIFLLGLLIFTT